jgi:iron complex transport system substrate-binding protein
MLAATAHAKPQRIVSLNLCTDHMVLELADRAAIRAVTYLASDPTLSPDPEKARGIPTIRGHAEEVMALDADLILAATHAAPTTVALLRRLGRPVVTVDLPNDFASMRRAVREVAAAIGEDARGAAWIANFDATLARLDRPAAMANAPTAIVYQPNNYATGAGLMSDMLAAAGLRNAARTLTTSATGQVTIESVLTAKPDLVVLSSPPTQDASVAYDNLRHTALRDRAGAMRVALLPWAGWICGTPHIARAIERLATLRDEISGEQ